MTNNKNNNDEFYVPIAGVYCTCINCNKFDSRDLLGEGVKGCETVEANFVSGCYYSHHSFDYSE